MDDRNKKIVNAEEQQKAVNPEGKKYENNTSSEDRERKNVSNEEPEKENPDGGSEIERPHKIEGDDADSIERKIPNL